MARVRIGDAGRERFFALLREHYAVGRVTPHEVRRRTEIVVSATYADEADTALAELPAIAVTRPDMPGGPAQPADQRPRRGLRARRGHAEAAQPAPGWVRTGERF